MIYITNIQTDISWVTIPNHDKYEISNTGIVRRKENIVINGDNEYFEPATMLRPCMDKKGLLYVNFDSATYYIHRLVAENFIPNPDNLKIVIHKNNITTNNNVNNLMWSSHSIRMKDDIESGKRAKPPVYCGKKVMCEETKCIYKSIKEASECTGICPESISNSANLHKSVKGLTFKFL